MVLQGKTDLLTLAKSSPIVDVRVFVGTKKKTNSSGKFIFGDDLITHFRLESTNPAIASALKKIGVDENNLTPELEIILAYDEPQKAFDCKAQRWSRKEDELSGLLWECDRASIYKKKILVDTPYGKKGRFIDCNEPCPVANTNDKCPQGCAENGTLYFYLPALLDMGYNALCSLVLSGEFNIRELSSRIQAIYNQFGTIKKVTASPGTYNSVLFRLGRYTSDRPHPIIYQGKRTGKTQLKPTHLVSLQIDPNWLAYYQNMQQVMEVQKLGYRPDLKLIRQVYGEGIIESSKEQIASSNNINNQKLIANNFMTRDRIAELQSIWRSHGWTEYALEELLISHFDISDRNALLNINAEVFELLKLSLASEEIKKEFIKG